jgi:pyruvate dehydrogenase E2 component (dihydrolipoamide acetyltransferase)
VAFEFRLPDIGEGLAEAEIVEWRVSVGDVVAMDQVVVDVETDKAVVEIPVPVAGTVLHLGGAEGDVVEVGAILIVVGEPGESWPGAGGDASPIVGTLDTEATTLSAGGVDLDARAADDAGAVDGGAGDTEGSGSLALPLVRRLAKEMGVDLERVHGTGPEGRITREDVMTAATATSEPWAPDHPGGGPVPRVPDHRGGGPEPTVGREDGRPLSRVRKSVAAHMSRSWSEIPHVTTFDDVDATRLLEVRKALMKRSGSTISIDALVVKAVLPALRAHPDFTARLQGDSLIDNPRLDIGVAVDTPEGLMVVVVRDAAAKSVVEVSTEIEGLAVAAKERRATPDQLSGQTFTVSNIGALGGGHGTPIIPYGTIGILSVGRATDRPVARSGVVEVAPVMPVSLSYDHRVIDGGQGRRFLALVLENLTEPALFLAD